MQARIQRSEFKLKLKNDNKINKNKQRNSNIKKAIQNIRNFKPKYKRKCT
jgi:hypothetical protein